MLLTCDKLHISPFKSAQSSTKKPFELMTLHTLLYSQLKQYSREVSSQGTVIVVNTGSSLKDTSFVAFPGQKMLQVL